jgi:hypothetical protein
MDIKSDYRELTEKIFDSQKEFHTEKAKLPVEEKIRILIELQKIAIEANPDKAKGKRVWKI